MACGGDAGADRLLVDVRTDLVPGVEIDRVTVEPVAPATTPAQRATAGPDDDFFAGVRVADFAGLRGEVRFRVLLERGDEVVLERPVVVEVRGLTAVTVLLSRDCRGVACPLPDGDPSAAACLGGACVEPTCTEEGATSCAAECSPDLDSECESPAACAPRACVAGVCVAQPSDGACAPDERCDPDLGCVPRVGGVGDVITFPPDDRSVRAVVEGADGAYHLVGAKGDSSTARPWVAQLDASGTERWARSVGAPGDGAFLSGGATADGGVVAGGFLVVPGARFDALVARFEPDGSLRWARALGDAEQDQATGVAELPDGDVVFVASAGFAVDSARILAGRLRAADGEIAWTNRLGDTRGSAFAIAALDSAGEAIVLSGVMEPLPVLIALGGDGSVRWAATLEGTLPLLLRALPGGDFLLGGDAGPDYLLARIGAAGSERWAETLSIDDVGSESVRALGVRGDTVHVGGTHADGDLATVFTVSASTGEPLDYHRLVGLRRLQTGAVVDRSLVLAADTGSPRVYVARIPLGAELEACDFFDPSAPPVAAARPLLSPAPLPAQDLTPYPSAAGPEAGPVPFDAMRACP